MILILLGAPGVGKGTQGVLISKEYGIPQISTGDILRKEVREETELGKKAKVYMDKGELVPDEVIIGMMENRIKDDDCKNGFILDGFPRTVAQAEAFDGMLKKNRLELDKVLLIDVPEEEIVDRLTGRRVCPNCGAVYHIKNNPPKNDNLCDKCGSKLIQRDDDKEDTVRNRLEVYKKSTMPLIDYYTKTGKLIKINGVGSIDEIFSRVKEVLG
ncbi:adenylate kinase [Hippea maritima]|uniref:Adenylate kinase n=1 Tax=Hippea maritima (strain ATCC 700847 / DSM 10411 / MH2) TaxID=760142 RepID=F2LXS1_HIPMA|nr:adenylate kinase [Hippea maritima]AEA34312.1 Adenylate kinase [Hippea maritima DSM 10411]